MQFLTRIITQMMHGPLGDKLANAQWMQKLAQNTNKGVEKWAKTAAEQKVAWTETSQAMKQNASEMQDNVKNSPVSEYLGGLRDEYQELKKQIRDDTDKWKNDPK